MSEDQFSPQELALIDRLKNAPQLQLSAEKVSAIRGQMLNIVDARPSPPTTLANGKLLLLTTLVIVAATVALMVLILPPGDANRENVDPTTTAPTSTVRSETATPTMETIPTATDQPSGSQPTDNASPATITPTNTIQSNTATATLIVETPVLQPTNTVYPVVVIEGPITEISANTITVWGIVIQIDSNDSIWSDIQIGDTVRIHGQTIIAGGTVTIKAITIVIVNIEDTSGGSTGGGLPPNCKRTKKGRITCK